MIRTVAEQLRGLSSSNLVNAMVAELEAFTVEPFDDDRVFEFEAGITEIARRAEIDPADARNWLVDQAALQGVYV